jgi:hypothetical protein
MGFPASIDEDMRNTYHMINTRFFLRTGCKEHRSEGRHYIELGFEDDAYFAAIA